jgi:hypothetical protein
LQLFSGFSQCQIVWDSPKITANFILLHGNGLEEQSLAVHVDMQESDFPITRRHFRLFHMKFASFVQVAEQATAKLHSSGETTLDFYQSIFSGVNPDPACHRVKDRSLV